MHDIAKIASFAHLTEEEIVAGVYKGFCYGRRIRY
jgi:hypothetical protein